MSAGLRVLCLVPYPTANAGVRLRYVQQLPVLEREGISLTLSSFLDEVGWRGAFERGNTAGKAMAVIRGFVQRLSDALRVGRFDVLLVYRESGPFGPRLVERAAARRRVPVVLDLDEATFIDNIHPANRRWARLRDPRRVGAACRLASRVITQNEYLAEYARRFNRRVTVIATPVDTVARHPRSVRTPGPVVVGWLGSETTATYLHLVDDVLARLSAELGIVVRVVGGEYSNPRISRLEVRAFELAREQSDLEGFDIGILPEPDDPWTRGKGGYKALLYMAAGIPVVASRVGVNPDIVADNETGFCVTGAEEWLAALRRLVTEPELRARFGAAGRSRAAARYSIQVVAPLFAAALRAAAERQ